MKKYFKKHWFEYVFSLVLTFAIALVVTKKFGYVYSTNDDVMIRNIINGNFSGNPDGHLIFISYALASVWKVLYNLLPDIQWYDLFTVVLHYLSWFLILVRVGCQVTGKKAKTILITGVMGLLVVIDLKFLVTPQFTVISAIMAGVAIFWLATKKVWEGFEGCLDYAVIILMLLLSASYRKEPFLLALPVVALVIVLDIWKRVKEKRELKTYILKAAVGVGIFGLLYLSMGIVEYAAYKSDAWKEFQRSQDARPQIYDYTGVPSLYEYEEAYKELGIDYADWMAIYTYNCGLADDFNAEKMEGVADISLQIRENWRNASKFTDLIKKDFYAFCIKMFENDIQPVGIFVIALYVLAFLVCYKNDDKKTCLLLAGLMLFYMAVFLYLIDQGRMPERVIYGIYFVQFMCLLAVITNTLEAWINEVKKERFWVLMTVGIYCFVVIVSFFYSWQIVKEERDRLVQNATDWEYINDYFEQSPEKRYCLNTASFVFSTEILFSKKVESDNMIRLGDWTLNSPLQKEKLVSQGVGNLVQQLVEEDDFYIVQEPEMGTVWINDICNHRGYDVEAVVTEQIITPGGRVLEVIQMQ